MKLTVGGVEKDCCHIVKSCNVGNCLDVNSFQVVITDVDAVLLQNPVPYFERYADADVLTSSDHLKSTVSGDSLETYPEAATTFNIGRLLQWKKNKKSYALGRCVR